LTQQDASDAEEATPRRFHVELFIVHPTMDPAEITNALGLEVERAHRVGDRRMTPKGTLLSGNYQDTRWRHSIQYDSQDQWFAEKIAEFVDRLEPHKSFLRHLKLTGGRASVIIQFLGDGYFSDELSRETLAQLVRLDVAFAIECF
jgi:hypothetical protein